MGLKFLLASSSLIFLISVSQSLSDELCHPSCFCLDTFFDCRKRGLTEFPDDFPNWVQKLNMSNNALSHVSKFSLSRLKQLKSLSLDGNNLTSIPNASDVLKDLTYLSLSRNMIDTVEASQLDLLKFLEELDLSRNRIEVLDSDSFPPNFTSLHVLNLGSNLIEQIEPGALDSLSGLEELSLLRNRIKSLHKDTFARLKNLESLDLSRNRLEVMDSLGFQELKRLQILNLRRNQIGNLSDAAFYGLDKIQHLYLDENIIRLVEKRWLYGLRSLKMLNLSHNEIGRIENDSWEYLEELQTLDLNGNKIAEISRKSLSGLSRLQVLDLSYNHLISIEEGSFATLEKLETLDLSYNRLSWVVEDIKGPFQGLGDCHTLNLAGNQIQSLHPKALSGLNSLKVLNLSSNPITWLSQKTFAEVPPSFQLIMVDVHSFICDCQAEWLQNRLGYLNGAKRGRHRDGYLLGGRNSRKFGNGVGGNSLVKSSGPVCAFPLELKDKPLLDVPALNLTCLEHSPRPVFLAEPSTQIFLMDGNGTLICNIESFGNSAPNITWRKDHQDLSKQLESQIEKLERRADNGAFQLNSTLRLTNVSWTDAGAYQCIAQSEFGAVYSAKANVTVHIFPSFVKTPANVTVRLGSNAKLECAAKGFPLPEIAFQKDGGEDFPAALDRRFHSNCLGVYSCSARNSAGEIKSFATVTVFETPSFSDPMEDEDAIEGSNAILECLASGSPRPQILWSKDGLPIVEGHHEKRYHLTENGSLLVIKDVQKEDAGVYECLLSNAVGTARGFSTLSVLPSSAKTLSLDTPTMTIIFIIIAVFCVVGTSAAWVVVIYRTRKRKRSHSEPPPGHRHSLARYEEEGHLTFTSMPPMTYSAMRIAGGDSGSQSSSGKDSGTGDDLPDTIAILEPTEEDGLISSTSTWRKNELETFSTFGLRPARAATIKSSGDVISLGRGKKVPMPVAPPVIRDCQSPSIVLHDTLEVTVENLRNTSSSSSSGYSSCGSGSLAIRSLVGKVKERMESGTSEEGENERSEVVKEVDHKGDKDDVPGDLVDEDKEFEEKCRFFNRSSREDSLDELVSV